MPKPKIIAIVGPTASGKTSLSIEIAKQFGGEVISADSRQIYRGMDIGTAKVTPEEMAGVPHHLIDIVAPNDTYTATDFKKDATDAILEIQSRGHLPIIAGGTFFYRDILRGKMEAAPVEPNLALREKLETLSTEALFEMLTQRDPVRAEAIDQHNRRRLIRSLEIIDSLGSVPVVTTSESPYDWLMIGLQVDKETILKNYSRRLSDWLESGFLEEVTFLLRAGVSRERFKEIGYEYTLALDFIDKKISEDEFKQRFIEKNWQFAKRQIMWLKQDQEIEWFTPESRPDIFKCVDKFLSN